MRMVVAFTMILLGGFLAVGAAQERKSEQGNDAQGQEMKLTGNVAKDMTMMNHMMMQRLGKKDTDFEKRFIDMMIPHHEGAILMAKRALKEANRPELKEMAQNIIKDQEKEIEQLKKWRQQWYGQK